MDISSDDRNQEKPNQAPGRSHKKIFVIALIAVVVGIALWWVGNRTDSEPQPETRSEPGMIEEGTTITATRQSPPATPQLPVKSVPPGKLNSNTAKPLPALDDSDDFVRDLLLSFSNAPQLQQWLSIDNLIRRATIFIDGLTRGEVLRKFVPVQPPAGKFQTIKEGQRYWINPSSYRRYDSTVDLLTAIDPEQLASTIHYLRPLFELAFSDQGYEDRDFGSTILLAINELLSTPTYEQPPELILESVYFKYQDPVIEKMSDAQKQLIRSGPHNTRKIQDYLQRLHAALLRTE